MHLVFIFSVSRLQEQVYCSKIQGNSKGNFYARYGANFSNNFTLLILENEHHSWGEHLANSKLIKTWNIKIQ